MKHTNNGACLKCSAIVDRYPGLNPALKTWFKERQTACPSMHLSCAGRGKVDQEAAKISKRSRASWQQSAHNWNAAIDLFEMQGDSKDIYELEWFKENIEKHLPPWLKWYGADGSPFYELPHVEIADWRELAAQGVLKLVE